MAESLGEQAWRAGMLGRWARPEDAILRVDGVKLARVYGQDNPIVGQIVAADLVIADSADREQVEDAVRAACRTLSRHSVPRNINFVDELELNNLKLSRRGKPTL